LTCDWRALYTRFFGEDKIYHDYLKKMVKEKEAWAFDMRQQMERGEINMLAVLERAVHTFADGSDDAKKIARRARIRRQLKEEGVEPDFEQVFELEEEKVILKRLQEREFMSSFEEYSDDEDEPEESEEEDGGGEDEEDEDEWEAEDVEVAETEDAEREAVD
jgi:hypothetical protein